MILTPDAIARHIAELENFQTLEITAEGHMVKVYECKVQTEREALCVMAALYREGNEAKAKKFPDGWLVTIRRSVDM